MTHRRIIKICAGIMAFSGLVILFSTIFPIVSYEWESAKRYPVLISPLVDEETASFTFSQKDYTKASNWFEGVDKKEYVSENVKYFTISIPKLKIENATVAIGGEDLSKSLIQFPDTALPGKVGNTVIFGHSILPIFYNPENYLAIFSTLDKLDKGDEVIVDYDGIRYKFTVENLFEVSPNDIQILEQDSSGSYLTLVTCSPPGDPRKPRRLIVRARLTPVDNNHAYIGS